MVESVYCSVHPDCLYKADYVSSSKCSVRVFTVQSQEHTQRQMWKVKQGQNTFSNKLLYMTWIAETEITNAMAKLNTALWNIYWCVYITSENRIAKQILIALT